jgi:lipoprotein-releasing system permease protein
MISKFDIWVSLKYILPKTREKFFSLITIFSFLGIALGVATLIIVMSVMNGFREELTKKILNINGHLKIQTYYNVKKNKTDIKSLINNKFNNVNINSVYTDQGLLNSKNFTTGVLLKGINYSFFEQRKILKNDFTLNQVESFRNNEGIVIGKKLADKLRLKLGDSIKIISSKSFFEIGMYEYDTSLVFFPLELMKQFLNKKNPDHYEILLNDFDNIDNIRLGITDIIPPFYKVFDWRQLNPSLFNAIEVERNVMFIILTLIIIVAAFNLISSMMILVSTKTKDIGILRVLGVSRFQLLKIFIINGLLIGLLGTISGLILGLLFCLNINEIKSFIELFSGTNLFSEEIYFFSNLPIIIDLNQIITISSISLSLSFFATIYPSIKASKVEPINLIKWE